MKNWTEKELIKEGYRIENAQIKSIDLSMADHGCMTLEMHLSGNGWGCIYGGYKLGNGYLGAKEFKSSPEALVSIMKIMDIVGCDRFNRMTGKYIRVAVKGWGDTIKIIGNVINDKWFDYGTFFDK